MGLTPSKGKFHVSTPSNIAFVKYWGKYGNQLPMNPSISMTLKNCRTEFEVEYEFGRPGVELEFEGSRNKAFEEKLCALQAKLTEFLPKAKNSFLKIKSSNTFPHSAGIASSASAMSAFALSLALLEGRENDLKFVSELARLCSGSASRSLYPEFAIWGESSSIPDASQNYAIEFSEANEKFLDLQDSIVIIDAGEKSVSSSAGHQLMENHSYRDGRVAQANTNFKSILDAMESGDFKKFGEILENEALSLHALMMSSHPSYILLKPLSLKLIEEIKTFRESQGLPVYFTIDAGPNIHVIYPKTCKREVDSFLNDFCHKNQTTCIHDEIGRGPRFEIYANE